MKHPFLDRLLMLVCAIAALLGTAGIVAVLMEKISLQRISQAIQTIDLSRNIIKAVLAGVAILAALIAVGLLSAMLPSRKKKSSNFAIQRNENGMVRISLKAIETLVSKCLNQHAELKVVTSSLYSDEESVRVDIHIALQSDISMPLAISTLQKQIKRYIEACSGVMVQEVRVFVDSTLPATDETASSPYAIPESLLHGTAESLSEGSKEIAASEPAVEEVFEQPAVQEETAVETGTQEPETEVTGQGIENEEEIEEIHSEESTNEEDKES